MQTPFDAFVAHTLDALQQQQFVKLTLGKKRQKTQELQNIYLRAVTLKGQAHLSCTWHFETRDETKNIEVADFADFLQTQLDGHFKEAYLFSTAATWVLRLSKKNKARLQKQAAQYEQAPARTHNVTKKYIISEDAPFLDALGVSHNGRVRATHQAKYRQINKYLEVVSKRLEGQTWGDTLRIVDMGAGKGYLTFALYSYLTEHKGYNVELTGIELRPHLVEFCNEKAKTLGYTGLHFLAHDIMDFPVQKLDILIALHACDTATDLAIAKGLMSKTKLIITAPCCHKQVRRDMQKHGALGGLLKHGILEERQAEMLTDGIRALLLESRGYDTQVFEFISTEHTGKNIMITATQTGKLQPTAREEVDKLKAQFGLETHYLETLLAKF